MRGPKLREYFIVGFGHKKIAMGDYGFSWWDEIFSVSLFYS